MKTTRALMALLFWVHAGAVGAQHRASASVETASVPTFGDSIQDVALWVHPKDPSLSLLFAADALSGGVFVYDLEGRQLQQLSSAAVAVDVRRNLTLADDIESLLMVYRLSGEIEFFSIEASDRSLKKTHTSSLATGLIPSAATFYRSASTGKLYVFGVGKGTDIRQWEVSVSAGNWQLIALRTLTSSEPAVSAAVDEQNRALFLVLPNSGLWKFDAEPSGVTTGERVIRADGTNLRLPVRAVGLYRAFNGKGNLVISNGEDRFSAYDRLAPYDFRGYFQVVADGGIDGVSLSKGIEPMPNALGSAFPGGVFLAHDGLNDTNPNLKLVRWESIARSFSPELPVTPYENIDGTDGGSGGEGGLGADGGKPVDASSSQPGISLPVDAKGGPSCNCHSTSGASWLLLWPLGLWWRRGGARMAQKD